MKKAKRMRVLVTGSTGFIGYHLVRALIEKGVHEVIATGRRIDRAAEFTALGVCYKACDLSIRRGIKELLTDVDCIVHCAGMAGFSGDYKDYYRANVLATEHLLEEAQRMGVKRFVNLSTASLYFDYKNHFNVPERYQPRRLCCHYAKTKYLAEHEVLSANKPRFQTVSIRPRLVIGEGDRHFLPRLLELHRQGYLVQVGDGANKVSLTSIDNVTDALSLCIDAPSHAMGQAYNIADSQPVKLWSLIADLLQRLSLPPVTKRVPYRTAVLAAQVYERVNRVLRPGKDIDLHPILVSSLGRSLTVDIKAAREQLGYEAIYTTDEALDTFCDWWSLYTVSR